MTHADTGLEARLRRLEDRAELTQLIARYAVAVDDRDLAAISALFTPDGMFRSKDCVMNARGNEAVLEQFRGRFRALKLSYHFSHDHIFEFFKAFSHACSLNLLRPALPRPSAAQNPLDPA